MPSNFAVTGRNPEFLITTLNRKLLDTKNVTETHYQEIALVDRNSPGEIALYPMNVSSSKEIHRGATERRKFSDANIQELSCRAGRVEQEEGTRISVSTLYDPYLLVQNFAGDLVRQCGSIWERELSNTINTNPIAYDGVPFFGTHSTNKNKAGAGTFSNDIIAPPTEAGVQEALNQFIHIPGFDGTLINRDLRMPMFVCPTMQIKVALDKLFNDGLIAEPIGIAGASNNTRLVGWGRTVYMPELLNNTLPDTARQYYIINSMYGMARPFIVRIRKEAQLIMSSGNDYYSHEYNARVLYYTAEGGTSTGLPQLAMRCRIS